MTAAKVDHVSRLLEAARGRILDSAHGSAERICLLALQMRGIKDTREVTAYEGKDPADKYTAWAAESLLWAIYRLREGNERHALRGYAQACLYKGQAGGVLPAGISDGIREMGKALEACLKGGT